MVNYDAAQPGNVASRTGAFTSQTRLIVAARCLGQRHHGQRYRRHWSGILGLGLLPSTDSQAAVDTSNARSDNGSGFGLLNCRGCSYSDVTTTCRTDLDGLTNGATNHAQLYSSRAHP